MNKHESQRSLGGAELAERNPGVYAQTIMAAGIGFDMLFGPDKNSLPLCGGGDASLEKLANIVIILVFLQALSIGNN
jgi:hypothetical protein